MTQPDRRDREIEALRERLSRLSEASRRINESLDFDAVLQGVSRLLAWPKAKRPFPVGRLPCEGLTHPKEKPPLAQRGLGFSIKWAGERPITPPPGT